MPFLSKVVSLPDNILFRIIGSFNMVQELLFYRVRPIPALRYFKNTVLMTGKSRLSMTMRTIPSLFRKKSEHRPSASARFTKPPDSPPRGAAGANTPPSPRSGARSNRRKNSSSA